MRWKSKLGTSREYASLVKVITPLVKQIMSQTQQSPDESLFKSAKQTVKRKRTGPGCSKAG